MKSFPHFAKLIFVKADIFRDMIYKFWYSNKNVKFWYAKPRFAFIVLGQWSYLFFVE